MVFFLALLALILCGLFLFYRWLQRHPSLRAHLKDTLEQAEQALQIGDWDSAASILQGDANNKQLPPKGTALYARALAGMRRLEKALHHTQEALKDNPGSEELRRMTGKLLLELDRPQEALELFLQCQSIQQDETGRVDLASAYYACDQAPEAWEVLQDSVLGSSNGQLLALAGDCHFRLKNFPLAVSFYQQAQHFGWNNRRTVARTGHSLQQSGKLRDAELYFRELLEHDSNDIVATLGLGTCYEARGQYHRALIIYQSGEAWDQADARILRQAGICAVHTDQFPFAEIYLKEALKRGLHSPQMLAYLGYSLETQQRWDEAEQVYLQLIEDYPEHAAGYRALAWLYAVGHSQSLSSMEGLSVAQKALELMPDDGAWELVSACEARAGNYNRAHAIQEKLTAHTHDLATLKRRRQAMRILRKRLPLNESLISRTLVA